MMTFEEDNIVLLCTAILKKDESSFVKIFFGMVSAPEFFPDPVILKTLLSKATKPMITMTNKTIVETLSSLGVFMQAVYYSNIIFPHFGRMPAITFTEL
jgi:hypothetical protein